MQRALGGADWRTIINRGELGREGGLRGEEGEGGLAMPTCLPASLLNAVRTFLHWETNNTENMQLLGGAMNSGEYSLSALQLFTNCDFIKNLTLVEFKAGPTQRSSSTLTSCHSLSVNVIRLSQTKSLRPE